MIKQKPPLAGMIGRALSRIYEVELNRRSRRFDRGIGVHRIDRPVISVGNLSVGGTGKTPTVVAVCRWLLEAGVRPCIAMRGYRAGPEGSDEQREYQRVLDNVAIVAQPDRMAGLEALFSAPEGMGIDCVVLDDGFQHRRIARDLDIVLIDATRNPFADRLLPAGWLREWPAALRRAHAVVATHAEHAGGEAVEQILEQCAEVNPSLLLASSWHHWAGLSVRGTDGLTEHQPVAWLEGRRVLTVCGIGNGEAFVSAASAVVGDELAGSLVLRDHARYDATTLARIQHLVERHGAEVVLTTRKDDVKLGACSADACGVPVAVVHLEIRFDQGEEILRQRVLDIAGAGNRIR